MIRYALCQNLSWEWPLAAIDIAMYVTIVCNYSMYAISLVVNLFI